MNMRFRFKDVAWHCSHPTIFGSVGDDQKLMM
jgi:hypothetical protein